MNETTSKRRTITLTGRRPVTIDEAEWPVIASATGDSWTGQDPALYVQASAQDDLDEYTLHVRQHADGRHLVYGTYTPSRYHQGDLNTPRRAGELLSSDITVEPYITLVGKTLHLPEQIIADCINSLTPTEL
jgi:hypothetical protein